MSTPPPVTLPGQRYLVTMADQPEPITVRVSNRELIAWDTERGKRSWPTIMDAPFLARSFTVFAAMKRSGEFAGNWDQFSDACEHIDETEATEARPTNPGPEGS